MSEKLEKYIAILGVILGSVAILLSWQANTIARRSVEPELIVQYTNFVRQSSSGHGDPMEGEAFCDYSYLVSNLGGVSTSIIGQEIFFTFADYEVSASSNSTYFRKNEDNDNYIEWVTSIIMTRPYTGTIVSDDRQSPMFNTLPAAFINDFPIQFESNSTQKLFVRTWYKFKNTHHWGPRWEDKEDYYPVIVSHNFQLSNGDILTGLPFTCYYLYPIE
ncbi:MAG: hypothetical protein H6657_15255 [Ardenticatenaceae bacterium]|nr:hypothetical protein [Ardenticatenaceae bacterium]